MDGSCVEAERLETATGNLRRGGQRWSDRLHCVGHAAGCHMHRQARSLNFLPTLRYVLIDGRHWFKWS